MLHSTLFAIVFALTARAASPPHYLDIIKRREPAIAGGQVVTLSPSGGVRIVPDKDTMGDGKYLKEDGVFYVISNPDGFNHKFTVKFYNEGQRKQMEIKCSLEGKLIETSNDLLDFEISKPGSQKNHDYRQSPCGKHNGVKIICKGRAECPEPEKKTQGGKGGKKGK